MPTRSERARSAIEASRVLALLRAYHPVVVSTIFVGLDLEDSDIDIVCHYEQPDTFLRAFSAAFQGRAGFRLRQRSDHVLGHFEQDGFEFEVYASATPVQDQLAYRHYRVMERLVDAAGATFAARTRELKATGLKTEPAICQLLSLPGDPYEVVLEIERWSDEELSRRLALVGLVAEP